VGRLDRAFVVPGVALGGALLLFLGLSLTPEADRRPPAREDYGIEPCPAGAEHDLHASRALQCWFPAPHGRWRTLSRVSGHGALMVEVEATSANDALGIARRFVEHPGASYTEVLIYVREEGAAVPAIRRVRWMEATGYELLEFVGASDQP
jgi:hypothetical protein